jgi:hypothetical protein
MLLPKEFVTLSAYFNVKANEFLKAKTAKERHDLLVILKEMVAEMKRREAGNNKNKPSKRWAHKAHSRDQEIRN